MKMYKSPTLTGSPVAFWPPLCVRFRVRRDEVSVSRVPKHRNSGGGRFIRLQGGARLKDGAVWGAVSSQGTRLVMLHFEDRATEDK